jgi:hypothetical protein
MILKRAFGGNRKMLYQCMVFELVNLKFSYPLLRSKVIDFLPFTKIEDPRQIQTPIPPLKFCNPY